VGQYSDRVGSTRYTAPIVTPPFTYSHYYPFGEEVTSTQNDRYKFAETFRDADSGLDYALNRYYAASIGRFLSVDPFGRSAVATNPQSWNRYAYVLGDPVNGTDPTGLVTYFSCDYGSEGFGKCGWKYAPDGVVGETSVGGGPTGAPYDSTSSELVRSLLKARLKGFADSNCGKLFAQAGIDVTKLTADGSTVRAFDARSTSVYQNVTHAAATGSTDTTTLANLPGAASTSALALTGPRPAIALYADFFGPPNLGSLSQSDQDAFKWEQENVALHELVHASAKDWDDTKVFGTSLFSNNGLDTRDYEQFGNTGAFTDWLKRDCKPPQ
jgi:RHS repeat-associated protein